MNHQFFDVSGSTPDAVIVQRRQAERFGKFLRGATFQRIGKPIPLGVLHYRRAKLVATWRAKDEAGKWQEFNLYGLKADGTVTASFFFVEDKTAVEVEALPALIKAMFASRIEVTL